MQIVGEGWMLQQWQADRLLAVSKIYTTSLTVDMRPGADHDYQVESDDETEFFLLDIRRSRRNPQNFRVQLRYQRDIVLARLCLSAPHTNPDGERLSGPHFHQYREEYGDKWAQTLTATYDPFAALKTLLLQDQSPYSADPGRTHMSDTANLLVESYLKWVKIEVSAQVLQDGVTQLTTPFVDRHNDHLQIYAEPRGPDLFLLTDDGYIVAELKSSAVETRGPRREEIFRQLLVGYGVELEGRELQTQASAKDLGQKVHNLVQAMLSLDDMFVLAQPTVHKIFLEDVANFLKEKGVRYTPRVKFAGKSELDHLVDFVIPKSREAPERVVQVLNSPRRDRVESILFSVSDTRAARGQEVSYYAILNDTRGEVPADILNAFSEYSVHACPWSQREELIRRLAI